MSKPSKSQIAGMAIRAMEASYWSIFFEARQKSDRKLAELQNLRKQKVINAIRRSKRGKELLAMSENIEVDRTTHRGIIRVSIRTSWGKIIFDQKRTKSIDAIDRKIAEHFRHDPALKQSRQRLADLNSVDRKRHTWRLLLKEEPVVASKIVQIVEEVLENHRWTPEHLDEIAERQR